MSYFRYKVLLGSVTTFIMRQLPVNFKAIFIDKTRRLQHSLLVLICFSIGTQSCATITYKGMVSSYSKEFKRRFLGYLEKKNPILRINTTNSSSTIPEILFTENYTNTIITRLDDDFGIVTLDQDQYKIIFSTGYGNKDKSIIPMAVKTCNVQSSDREIEDIINGYGILGYEVNKNTGKRNIFFIKLSYNWIVTESVYFASAFEDSVSKFIWAPLHNKYIIPISMKGRNNRYNNLGILTLEKDLQHFNLKLWSYKGNQYPVEIITENTNNYIIAGNAFFVNKNFFLLRFNHKASKPNKFMVYTSEGDNIINSFKKLQNRYLGIGYYDNKLDLYNHGWLISLNNSFNMVRSLLVKGIADIVLYDYVHYNNSIIVIGHLSPDKLLLLEIDKNLTICLGAKVLDHYRKYKMQLSQISDRLYATALNLRNETVLLYLQNIYNLKTPFKDINITLKDITSKIESKDKYMKSDVANYFDIYNYSLESRNILFNAYSNLNDKIISNTTGNPETTKPATTTTTFATSTSATRHSYYSMQTTEWENSNDHAHIGDSSGQTNNILNLNNIVQVLIGGGCALVAAFICYVYCKCIKKRKELRRFRNNISEEILYHQVELANRNEFMEDTSEHTTKESSSLIKENDRDSNSNSIPENDFINIEYNNHNDDEKREYGNVENKIITINNDNNSTGSSIISTNSLNIVGAYDANNNNSSNSMNFAGADNISINNVDTPMPPRTDSSTLDFSIKENDKNSV